MESMEPARRGGHFFFALLLGIALGVAGTILIPRWAAPYLPESFGGASLVEGQVLDKSPELDRLLLKVTTEQGVFLATFTERQEEIDLLVDSGDTITLNVPRYQPFLDNPAIKAVRKTEPPSKAEQPPVAPPMKDEIEKRPQVDEPEPIEPPAEPTGLTDTTEPMETTEEETPGA